MGKSYAHQYFFAGQGCTCGTMVCATCGQPIFNHTHDWLAYRKDRGGDWGFICHHRKCWSDQSGWEKAEALQAKHADKMKRLDAALLKVCQHFGMTMSDLRDHIEDDDQ